ncbi:MAG TPA: glutamine-hydrolyzing carbamoyl-phosphate synthase small subunit [Microbacteriaceae bacterium]
MLENGQFFQGDMFGSETQTLGEVVFATGMTGYQETLTDPSYAGQIVVQTAPHIGNTGMNERDMESSKNWVAGYVVREYTPIPSNFRSERTLADDLKKDGIVAIEGVDTRALTIAIRDAGAMRGGIFPADGLNGPTAEMIEAVNSSAEMKGLSLSAQVTTDHPYTLEATSKKLARLAVLDLGVKKATLDHLRDRGLELVVMPSDSTAKDIREQNVDALFYSNGPGDPEASEAQVETLRELLKDGMPFFGICFGNQLLGRALGFETYKLQFGHRGINQPVFNKETGRVEVTAHNHGFAVALDEDLAESPAGFGSVQVRHRSLNDGVVEGLKCLDIDAFSVQYHPEAAAGPHDSHYLFDEFIEMIGNKLAKKN